MKREEATHRVVYYAQARMEEFIIATTDGRIIDAGPLLRTYKGKTIAELRTGKMVTKFEVLIPPVEIEAFDTAPVVEEAEPAKPAIVLTDME